jgi:hypothetical protein
MLPVKDGSSSGTKEQVMKRLISAALALTLLGATAASAAPAHGGQLVPVDYRDHSYRHRDNGAGAAIGIGIGLFALGAILASQNHHDHDGWYDRDRGWQDRDWRGRDDGYRSYDQGYGYRSYDNRGYGGYGYSAPYRGW